MAETNTRVTFLGTDSVVPDIGNDTASFLFNGNCLVDTGWSAALRMRAYGFEPTQVDTLFLTHCHHDHYLGLPQLLFHRRMRPGPSPLRIVGPAGDLERVVGLARQFLQVDRFPEVGETLDLVPLAPGESLETDAFRVTTCASRHPVPALCYRFLDKRTGRSVAYTGDTAPHPPLVDHVRNVDLLITEASYGPRPAPDSNPSLHSGAPDAARLARDAAVGRLALVHATPAVRAAALEAARAIFPETFWPEDGETVNVGA